MRLSSGGFRHHDERHLARLEALGALRTRENSASRREDARHTHEVACGNARRAQRQLERRQFLAMLADAFRKKHLLGHESDHSTLLSWHEGTRMVTPT